MSAYERLLERAGELVQSHNGTTADLLCPAHEDRKPSLRLSVGENENALIFCHAGCETDDVLGSWNLPTAALFDSWWEQRNGSEPLAIYTYADEHGTALFEVGRFPGKRFPQRKPGRDDWKGGIQGVRRVLYRLPEVIAAAQAGQTVYVVEGEKDVHAIERAGGVATCNPGGAGKWRREYADALSGADVIVVADKDDPGRKHAAGIVAMLPGSRLVEAKTGKDARDHLAAGHGLGDFETVRVSEPLKGTRTPGHFVARPADPTQMKPLEWVWKSRLVRGALNLSTGEESIGKSTFQVWIAARVTRGELPGIYEGKPRDVLFVGSDEDAWDEIVMPRLHAARADFSRIHELYSEDEQVAFDVTRVDELGAILGEREYGLVVFEQLMDALPPMHNRNDPGELRAQLRPLARCCRRQGVGGLGSLHVNKAPGASFREAQQGSVQWNAVSRSSLLIAKHPADPTKRVAIVGKGNYVQDKDEAALEFTVVEHVFVANERVFNVGRVDDVEPSTVTEADVMGSGPSQRAVTRDRRMDAVRSALTDVPQSVRAIAKAASEIYEEAIPKSTVQNILENLDIAQEATQTPDGWTTVQVSEPLKDSDTRTPPFTGDPNTPLTPVPDVCEGCGAMLTETPRGAVCIGCASRGEGSPPPGGERMAAMFTSQTDDWATPQDFYDQLHAEFDFTLDPAATPDNAKCERFFTAGDDGLAQEWTGRVWLNPPYGRTIGLWMAKAWEASQTTAELVVCLVPARTDTRWWHDYAARGEVRFLSGRLRFGGAENSAPFPSAVVVFRRKEANA